LTLGDKIREAIANQDATAAGRIADRLRFKCGLNYSQSLQIVMKAAPDDYDPAEWDALLYEADRQDSRGLKVHGL